MRRNDRKEGGEWRNVAGREKGKVVGKIKSRDNRRNGAEKERKNE